MNQQNSDAIDGLDATIGLRRGDLDLRVTVRVERGQILALLGPNGAGKTTTLHALAGLVAIDDGHVTLDGVRLADPSGGILVEPHRRPVSLVFQDYLLFPHLSALDNVAFGLAARGTRRAEARFEALSWLTRVGLGDRADSMPRELSGGQSQRVALARALAPSPSLLLLDEPLSALDVATRSAVRSDLRRHLHAFDGAAVVVTHDPVDALALATHVTVLDAGSVVQAGPVQEIATRPRSRFVADLVGVNLLPGSARGHTIELDGGATVVVADDHRGDVFVLVRPQALALHETEPEGSPRNRWPLTVHTVDHLGDRVRVDLRGVVALVAEVTPAAVAELGLREGRDVWVSVKATEPEVYPR